MSLKVINLFAVLVYFELFITTMQQIQLLVNACKSLQIVRTRVMCLCGEAKAEHG